LSRAKLFALALICTCAVSACFQWTEDSQGNLQSVGLPGVPIWKSSAPPAELKPADLGFTPEEASKFGGPVLVEPPAPGSRAYRYRFYSAGNNKCESDLKKLLAERRSSGATGPEPYCTNRPTGPATRGNGFVF
jgi:hypothetical protein